MIIYSEILGELFDTVEDCLKAEEEAYKKAEEEQRKKEREQLEDNVRKTYSNLVNAWIDYKKAIDKAGYDIDTLEEMAIIFVEVISDAEARQDKTAQS